MVRTVYTCSLKNLAFLPCMQIVGPEFRRQSILTNEVHTFHCYSGYLTFVWSNNTDFSKSSNSTSDGLIHAPSTLDLDLKALSLPFLCQLHTLQELSINIAGTQSNRPPSLVLIVSSLLNDEKLYQITFSFQIFNILLHFNRKRVRFVYSPIPNE